MFLPQATDSPAFRSPEESPSPRSAGSSGRHQLRSPLRIEVVDRESAEALALEYEQARLRQESRQKSMSQSSSQSELDESVSPPSEADPFDRRSPGCMTGGEGPSSQLVKTASFDKSSSCAALSFRPDLNEAEQKFRVAQDKARTRTEMLQCESAKVQEAAVRYGSTFLSMLVDEAARQNANAITKEQWQRLRGLLSARAEVAPPGHDPIDENEDDGFDEVCGRHERMARMIAQENLFASKPPGV